MTARATYKGENDDPTHQHPRPRTSRICKKISHVSNLLAEYSKVPMRRAGLEKLDAKLGEKVLGRLAN